MCTEQCWVADSKRARRCHECVGAGESAGETESVKDPVKRSDGDTHVSSSCSWSGLPVVQDELPEVLEKEALSSFRFNPHAAPFSPHAITKGRTEAIGKASEKADQDYVDDAADAAYTIIGVGMYGLTEICSVQDSPKTSSFPTSSAFKTSIMQCSVQLPVQVQNCAVCNMRLCSDFISSWTTTCNECNRMRRCWTQTGAASSSKDTSVMHETDEAVDRESRRTISAAIFEDSDVETDIATSITPEATSSTRALTLILSPEETQSVANSRSSRRIIGTEWY